MATPAHRPSHVFVTHCHSDHSYNLPNLISSRHFTSIYTPRDTVPFVHALLDASQKLNALESNAEAFAYATMELVAAIPNDVISISDKYCMRVIQVCTKQRHHCWYSHCFALTTVPHCVAPQCMHTVPCVGYLFYEKRLKLKPEYAALSGREIGALRKAGTQVQCTVEIPMFAFLGDTSIELFEQEQQRDLLLPHFAVIFIECTALQDGDLSVEDAKSRGHMHWNSLKDVVVRFPETTFVLMHFSARYKPADITEFFEQQKAQNPGLYHNVVPWI
jgi:ribonuclease Z